MKCNQCRERYGDKRIVLSIRRMGNIVAIEGVPAMVCEICGDTLLSESTVRAVDKLLDGEPDGAAPLYHFPKEAIHSR